MLKNCIIKVSVSLVLLVTLTNVRAQSGNSKYDKLLADSLGADEYGMKMYVLVILKTGNVKINNREKVDSIFSKHFENIVHLAATGKLVVSGPIKKNEKNYEGIFILNVGTIAEANALLETDPAVRYKLLDTDFFQWYGSAALPLYLQFHDSVKKKEF